MYLSKFRYLFLTYPNNVEAVIPNGVCGNNIFNPRFKSGVCFFNPLISFGGDNFFTPFLIVLKIFIIYIL